MKLLFGTALLVATSLVSAATSTPSIAPFRADYVALRDGKELGETTIEWKSNGDGTYTLRTSTRGTSGLAKLAGLDVTEESVVRWNDGSPETVRYDFKQDAAFSKRNRHAEIDWNAGSVAMQDNKDRANYATVPGLVDRHAVVLSLANSLARKSEKFDYKVAMKDGVEDFQYSRSGNAKLSVPAGDYDTVALVRKRGQRVSTSWFSEQAGWVPVQIEQVDGKKNETITLKLKSLKRGDR